MTRAILTPPRYYNLKVKGVRKLVRQRDEYEQIFAGLIEDLPLRADCDRHAFQLSILGAMNWTVFWYTAGGRLSVEDVGRQIALMVRGAANGATTKNSGRPGDGGSGWACRAAVAWFTPKRREASRIWPVQATTTITSTSEILTWLGKPSPTAAKNDRARRARAPTSNHAQSSPPAFPQSSGRSPVRARNASQRAVAQNGPDNARR